jgi:hypothetical protein
MLSGVAQFAGGETMATKTTELRWLASASASCFHAVAALLDGRTLTDAAVAEALTLPAAALAETLTGLPRSPADILEHVVALSAGIENNRQLADVATLKALGHARSTYLVDRLAGHFAELEAAFLAAVPDVVEQLSLRWPPLHEQWEARGPGLLFGVRRLTEADLLVESAQVVLVHPVLGGGGAAHLPYNSVRIEAVLTNNAADLPEVVRLAWLVAQLQCDLPMYQGEIHRDRLPRAAALALLPVALTGGTDVELTACDAPAVARALDHWMGGRGSCRAEDGELGVSDGISADDLAAIVWQWWETYHASRPRWSVALAALDKMLA